MKLAHGIITACIIVLSSGAPAAELLVNGTFDTPVPSNGTGGGWTSASIQSGGWNSSIGNPPPAFLLNSSPYSSDPIIYQTVSGLLPGEQYMIRGEYGLGYGGGTPTNSFEVRVDGSPILQLGPDPDHDPSPGTYYPFKPFSVLFTATSTSHVILFAAEVGPSDHDYFVDNLSMTPRPVAVESSQWGGIKSLYR